MVKKIVFFLVVVFVLQLLFVTIIVAFTYIKQLETGIESKITRINEDISIDGSKWDISRYNSDSQLIGNYPLYLISTDGFVVDRRSPIGGYLDSSNFAELLKYQTIQTRDSVTGYVRRIYSLPIKNESGEELGVVTVSYFNPREEVIEQVDEELYEVASAIHSKIDVIDNRIDTSKFDSRMVPFNISFVIVDKYNTTVRRSTNVNNIRRTPNFIDPSYVKRELSSLGTKFVRDNESGELFVVTSQSINENGKVMGLVVIGENLHFLSVILKNILLIFGVMSALLLSILGYIVKKSIKYLTASSMSIPKQIWFDSVKSMLHIDQNVFEIAYSTNQYYLLKALFSNPTKRWENDELLDRFGGFKDKSDARKIYDTMINVNKKLEGYLKKKLILNQNKTYHLNPNLPIEKSPK